jgi:hypothetical protein
MLKTGFCENDQADRDRDENCGWDHQLREKSEIIESFHFLSVACPLRCRKHAPPTGATSQAT